MKSDIFKLVKEFTDALDNKLDIKSISAYIKKQGINLVYYGTADKVRGNDLISEMNLTDYSKDKKSFALHLVEEKENLIFINNTIPEEERIHALLHELAHFMPRHLTTREKEYMKPYKKRYEDIIEHEAETFAYLAMRSVHKKSITKPVKAVTT